MGIVQNTINTALLASAAAYKFGGGPEIADVHKAKKAMIKAGKKLSLALDGEGEMFDPNEANILEKNYVQALFKAGEKTGITKYTLEALQRQENTLKQEQEFNKRIANTANNRVMETAKAKVEQKDVLDKRRDLLKEQISFGKGSKGTLGDLRPELRDRIIAQLEEEENGNK